MDESKFQTGTQTGSIEDALSAPAFLLTVKDKLSAGAYEEMLRKNRINVLLERRETSGPYGVIIESGGSPVESPVNLYVAADQLERARILVDAFDNQPILFKKPPPALNRKSRSSQVLFTLIIILIFIVPLGASLIVIGSRIFNFFTR